MATRIRSKVGKAIISKKVNGKWNIMQNNKVYITTRHGNLGFVITIHEENGYEKEFSEGSFRKNMSKKLLKLPVTITRSEFWNSWSNYHNKFHYGALFSPEMVEELDEKIKDGFEFKFRQYLPKSDAFAKWKIEFEPECSVREIVNKAIIARL